MVQICKVITRDTLLDVLVRVVLGAKFKGFQVIDDSC